MDAVRPSFLRWRRLPALLGRLPAHWTARFDGPAPATASPPLRPAVSWLLSLAVVAVAASLFFTRLGCPLLEPEEARYAEIPRQMLAQGRLVEPVWHGEPY